MAIRMLTFCFPHHENKMKNEFGLQHYFTTYRHKYQISQALYIVCETHAFDL